MPVDRDAALRNAKKSLRQGKVEPAIAEYVRLVEDQPQDWNSANALGDLYVRVRQIDKAIAQFMRSADNLFELGFAQKAGALYKKVLKLNPDEEQTLLKGADSAASLGLMADARAYLDAALERRLGRGEDATDVLRRAAQVFPGDADLRSKLAQALLPEQDVAPVPRLHPPPPTVIALFDSEDTCFDLGATPMDLGDVPNDLSSPAPTAHAISDLSEVDLSMVFDGSEALTVVTHQPPPVAPAVPASLDDVFGRMREEAAHRANMAGAEEQFRRGLALRDAGDLDGCLQALQTASHAPALRFAAASLAGHILRERGMTLQAIDWLERAAEAPAPSAADSHQLLYDLADCLEATGEGARALAVLIELLSATGPYRDAEARIARLTMVQARG